jgi:hypothetical protein
MTGSNSDERELSERQRSDLLGTLESRFRQHLARHEGQEWREVRSRLEAHPEKLWSLGEMERTGGEPDVVSYDAKTGEFIFVDCSAETARGRRNVCYDREGQEARKEHKPADNAVDVAAAMGIELLTEEGYFGLQQLGEFDLKTSSWLKTPADVRELGGAIFGDRRYGRVFVYHNGAPTYYSSRAFRGSLTV